MAVKGNRNKAPNSKLLTTIEMEIGLMEYFNIRANVIVPNCTWGIVHDLHECDLLILTPSDLATEVEIKISKADLMKDMKKFHGHHHNHIYRLYYAVPEKLKQAAIENIPQRAGLLVVKRGKTTYYSERKGYYDEDKYFIDKIKPAAPNKLAMKWTENNRFQLMRLGTMRILGLKKKIANYEKEKYKNA